MSEWEGALAGSALLRDVRLVPLTQAAPAGPVDVRVRRGRVVQVGPGLAPEGEETHDGGGRWLMPGLWDQHVHLGQAALTRTRIDVSAAQSAPEAAAIVARALPAGEHAEPWRVIQGFGQRPALWPQQPTAAALDEVVGDTPVVLVSGDAHHGWLSTAAFHVLGIPPREGILEEEEWWPVFARLSSLPGAEQLLDAGYRATFADCAALGLVGITDLEMGEGWSEWPGRVADGLDTMRLRPGVYRQDLAGVLEAGVRTGDPLGDSGLVTMGPLKVISDGSLNTRTAFCCEPFADSGDLAEPFGVQNVTPEELRWLLDQATDAGLEAAIHAIGDHALADALDAFEQTGARGSVEHAQLVRLGDVPRMAALGVRASVQPVHLWDDRDVIDHCWPDRAQRCFPLATMRDAGVELALGSDAPVAPLDPWLAVAAAVHRSADEREPWQPQEALTLRGALAASTDGQGTVAPGSRADLLLLDVNPLDLEGDSRAQADAVRRLRPLLTMVAGRVVHTR
ncbi:hypothetical protein FB554_2818 [Barrientosiimonas humi]|uniref:Amidohydrolase 3 domain-containing protein n=1 Tax=Barrientosiimonas humi TaxID=999931 RepID=A0A542XFP7_9MICO|nr:amidohydrolase family protein [Barrientosiimonas humi]TQL34642.1 hypothetical protein FB554_2818 [Barrientosiimonas humi]CAG7574632.1 N-substituted formamide deformylase [Barrientosiimonas humi]